MKNIATRTGVELAHAFAPGSRLGGLMTLDDVGGPVLIAIAVDKIVRPRLKLH